MSKILVTGGLGVIGAFVSRAILSKSHQPVILDMGMDISRVRDIAADCVIEQGDICDLPRLLGIISRHKPVAIAHLSGQVGPHVEQLPWSSLKSNLIGTTTIFEAARLSGIQRVVFSSAKQVYGVFAEKHRHPNYEPIPEDHPRGDPPKFYGKLKRACEDFADHYARLYGLDIIALRFGSSFGPGKFGRDSTVSPIIDMIEAAIANRPFRMERGGEQRDDMCYAGESANGFVAALESEMRPGTFRAYNIASGEFISLQEMIAVLKELYPSWSAEVGPGLDYRGLGVGAENTSQVRMSTEKARAELGFKPAFNFRRAVIDYAATLDRLTK